MTGGLIWGVGQALLERSEMDHRLGRFLSKNLAGYLIPMNADVGEIDVAFINEPDPVINPLGARGIGELGAIGSALRSRTPCFTQRAFACVNCPFARSIFWVEAVHSPEQRANGARICRWIHRLSSFCPRP